MKSRIMVIYDSDPEYGRKLMAFLNQKEDFPFEVQMVTSQENLEQVLIERKADVLLLGEENVSGKENTEVFILSESESEEPHRLYKYQSMEHMIDKIQKGLMPGKEEDRASVEGGFFMMGIYSPSGGCGKTLLSMELARRYSREGKTLYLNFDLIGNTFPDEPEIICNDVQELFYGIHERTLAEDLRMESFFCKASGVFYLGPSPYRRELWNLTREDMSYWLSGIRSREEFQYVILDIGFFNEAMLEAMKQCDKVILLNGKYELQREKTDQFYGMLEFCKEDVLKQNIREFEAPEYGEYEKLAGKLVV